MARPNSRAIRISGGRPTSAQKVFKMNTPPGHLAAASSPSGPCRPPDPAIPRVEKIAQSRCRDRHNRMILCYNGIWHKYGISKSN